MPAADSYRELIDGWVAGGFDYVRGEHAANEARSTVASLMEQIPPTLR